MAPTWRRSAARAAVVETAPSCSPPRPAISVVSCCCSASAAAATAANSFPATERAGKRSRRAAPKSRTRTSI
jgi:hypothetical protein